MQGSACTLNRRGGAAWPGGSHRTSPWQQTRGPPEGRQPRGRRRPLQRDWPRPWSPSAFVWSFEGLRGYAWAEMGRNGQRAGSGRRHLSRSARLNYAWDSAAPLYCVQQSLRKIGRRQTQTRAEPLTLDGSWSLSSFWPAAVSSLSAPEPGPSHASSKVYCFKSRYCIPAGAVSRGYTPPGLRYTTLLATSGGKLAGPTTNLESWGRRLACIAIFAAHIAVLPLLPLQRAVRVSVCNPFTWLLHVSHCL